MGRPLLLTPALRNTIVTYIKGGCFIHDAARACGVGPRTLFRWLEAGRRKKSKEFWQFWLEVQNAQALAKVVASNRVFKENPLAWLKVGPGRADWKENAELTVVGDADRPLRVEESRPAPVQTLAQGYLILQELGIMPQTDPDGQALLASFSEAEPDAPGEGEDVEGGVPNVLTAAPEWMRRTPGQGRKRGGGGGKKGKGKGKKGKDKEGGGAPPSGP